MQSKTGEGDSHQRFIDQAVRLAAVARPAVADPAEGAVVDLIVKSSTID